EKPLVSVVIPTHNRAQLLQEAIESVLAQQGAGEQFDMEVIVVDDASSDDTPDVMRKYPQVRHIRLTTNHGEGGSRNVGIKASHGKYIAFLDDDDVMLPGRLKLQVPAMEAHSEVGVVYSQNIIRGKGLDKWWPDALRSGDVFDKTWPNARHAPSGDVFQIFLKEEFLSMDTLLVRREAFHKAGYFENYPTEAHYDMFLRLAFHVPFLFVAGNVAINRVNLEGVFHARLTGEEGCARMLPQVIEKALAMLPDTTYSRKLRREVHVAVVPRLFCMVERIPEIEDVRSYAKIAFRTSPWLLTESEARNTLAANADLFVRHRSPISVTRVVCDEIKAVWIKRTLKDWLKLRILLADIWMTAAMSLGFGSPSRPGAAVYAAIRALFCNPLSAGPDCFKLALRIIVGPRVYACFRLLKRQRSDTNLATT
ncbi:MAG TPA: glycosyltransferase family 2 protein, partial [Candidatus Binatia bacterium]